MVEKTVKWYDHPDILEIDEYVQDLISPSKVDLYDAYLGTFNEVTNREAWKPVVFRWIDALVYDLQFILELVEELDEDEREEVTIDV
jgi:hypothetical protein